MATTDGPLVGTSGTITVNGTALGWSAKWTAKCTNNAQTIGPHIGDANEYEVNTSQKWEFTLEGTVPRLGDTGQNALFTAVTSRLNSALVLTQTEGKRITFSAPRYGDVEFETDANGTQTWKVSGTNGSGTGTLAQV